MDLLFWHRSTPLRSHRNKELTKTKRNETRTASDKAAILDLHLLPLTKSLKHHPLVLNVSRQIAWKKSGHVENSTDSKIRRVFRTGSSFDC